MAIKKLQNNFTTPEQSKRLLELGLPADSADCYYVRPFGNLIYNKTPMINYDFRPYKEESQLYGADSKRNGKYSTTSPCWSVGRLMEIAHICSDSTLSYKEEAEEIMKFKEEHKCETIVEAIIMCIEDANSLGIMNFSKLED